MVVVGGTVRARTRVVRGGGGVGGREVWTMRSTMGGEIRWVPIERDGTQIVDHALDRTAVEAVPGMTRVL